MSQLTPSVNCPLQRDSTKLVCFDPIAPEFQQKAKMLVTMKRKKNWGNITFIFIILLITRHTMLSNTNVPKKFSVPYAKEGNEEIVLSTS